MFGVIVQYAYPGVKQYISGAWSDGTSQVKFLAQTFSAAKLMMPPVRKKVRLSLIKSVKHMNALLMK